MTNGCGRIVANLARKEESVKIRAIVANPGQNKDTVMLRKTSFGCGTIVALHVPKVRT